jgi:predicted DNA-binding transcriptional regulator AlpA
MKQRDMPLIEWAQGLSTKPPSPRTLRRWRQNGNIFPRPKKLGGKYVVSPNARYIDTRDPNYIEEVAAAMRSE